MFSSLRALFIALFLVGFAPGLAQGQGQALCGERTQLLENLERAYGETPRAIGLSQDGGLLEILVSPAGGWSILVTYPNKPSCVVATGESWESRLAISGEPV